MSSFECRDKACLVSTFLHLCDNPNIKHSQSNRQIIGPLHHKIPRTNLQSPTGGYILIRFYFINESTTPELKIQGIFCRLFFIIKIGHPSWLKVLNQDERCRKFYRKEKCLYTNITAKSVERILKHWCWEKMFPHALSAKVKTSQDSCLPVDLKQQAQAQILIHRPREPLFPVPRPAAAALPQAVQPAAVPDCPGPSQAATDDHTLTDKKTPQYKTYET